MFKDSELPDIYKEAIEEFKRNKDNIKTLLESNWKQAADELEKLQITELTRETLVEIMYRLILQDRENKEKLLSVNYTWSSSRDSVGEFVGVGDFDAGGVGANGSTPGSRHDNLGFSFSRSV